MKWFTVVGIYPDGEPQGDEALESYVEHVDANSGQHAALLAVDIAPGRHIAWVVAVFEGKHVDRYEA